MRQVMWPRVVHRIKSRELRCVNFVDFDPSDLDQST